LNLIDITIHLQPYYLTQYLNTMKALPDTKSIGENIRLLCKANGMKVAEATDKLDTSESAYTRHERGALSPTADFLGKIATVINAHPVLLLTVPAKRLIRHATFFLSALPLMGLSQAINGTVVDAASKSKIEGVYVAFDGYKGTITDKNGNFSIAAADSSISKKLTFSHIGYADKSSICYARKKNVIPLDRKSAVLDEVTVRPKKSILEQAIEKIPINYPARPIMQTGLIRLYSTIKECDFFFKGDAEVDVFTPAYAGKREEQSIRLRRNTRTLIQNENAECVKNRMVQWVGGYATIGDAVFSRPPFMTVGELDNYLFHYGNNMDYKGRRTHVINFASKKGKTEGVIYIDSATKAFPFIEYTKHDIHRLFFVPIAIQKRKCEYALLNGKWYIDKTRTHSTYLKIFQGEGIREFQSIAIDSINAHPIPYSERMQFMDNQISVLKKGALGKSNDSLISQYERDSVFSIMPAPALSKSTETAQARRIRTKKKALVFLTSITPSFMFKSVPMALNYYSPYIPSIFGTEMSFPVYKGLSVRAGTYGNFGIGSATIDNYALFLEREIIINKTHRPMRIIPYSGISYLSVKEKSEGNKNEAINGALGARFGIELSRRTSFFIGGEYLKRLKSNHSISDFTYREMSFSAGLMFHLIK